MEKVREAHAHLAVLGPLVLAADLVLLFGSEVILDVEGLADLVGRLALDHVGDRLAAYVKESLDVEVVGGKDNLEQHLLVDLHELLVPLINVGRLLARVGIVVLGGGGVLAVVLAPLEDLLHDRFVDLCSISVSGLSYARAAVKFTYVGNGDGLLVVDTEILQQVLDQDGALGNIAIHGDLSVVGCGKLNLILTAIGDGSGSRHGGCSMWMCC